MRLGTANELPTAKQPDVLRHETPRRSLLVAPGAFGALTIDHFAPFHCSINTLPSVLRGSTESDKPTAIQVFAAEHDTSTRSLSVAPVGARFGLATMAHFVPFHRSDNVCAAPEPVNEPTATQFFGPGHDTPSRLLK
jgi:hypothetical protein